MERFEENDAEKGNRLSGREEEEEEEERKSPVSNDSDCDDEKSNVDKASV